jgi:hypothetical protein
MKYFNPQKNELKTKQYKNTLVMVLINETSKEITKTQKL